MSTLEIRQDDNGETGSFYVKKGEEVQAGIYYSWRGKDRIIIEHTEVGESLKGKGVGRQLVEKAVKFARAQGIRIVPLCPFAKSVLTKSDDYSDVL